MKIFVTGGSGFVGQALLRHLLQQGHELGAIYRSEASRAVLQQLGVQHLVAGSLDDITRWQQQLAGYQVVIHAAAPIELWGPWSLFQQQIVDATQQLLLAAEQQGVPRLVYLSSESVWQDAQPLLDIDESLPPVAQPNSSYGLAKKLAEQILLQHQGPIQRVILRPAFIWGPNCPALQQVQQQVRSGQFVWVDQGQAPFSAIHIDNLLPAISAACQLGRDGGIYALTDDVAYSVRSFFTPLLQQASLPIPRLSLPSWLLRPVAKSGEWLWRHLQLAGKPPLTRFELAFVSQPRRYRIESARRDLGFAPQAVMAQPANPAAVAAKPPRLYCA